MAITSRGYAGTIDDVDWSAVATQVGGSYSVFGTNPFALSSGPGDRQVVLSPGTAAGAGVVDTSDSNVTLSAGVVASGSRWDMVVLRRNWTTKVSTLAIVPGSASKVLPTRALRENGTTDEQPLYLLRFAAGQTTVQEIVDLRVWLGDGGAWAADLMVRDYMNRIGTRVRVGTIVWERVVSTGSPLWLPLPDADLRANGAIISLWGPNGWGYSPTGTSTLVWSVDGEGELKHGKVPAARITGVLPLEHGGLGAETVPLARKALGLGETDGPVPVASGGTAAATRAGALLNLGFRFLDTGTITLAPGQEFSPSWAVDGFVGDWVCIPSSTNPNFTLIPTRAGSSVGVRIVNSTDAPRTGTVMAIIAKYRN